MVNHLSKAVALSIIMAQSGCLFPCKSFVYYQYTQLNKKYYQMINYGQVYHLTKLKFLEMKHILNHANKNSLVIGDEVFNSSELNQLITSKWLCPKIKYF